MYDVNDLEPGHEYGFAVKASNAVGDSDALPTAKLIVAKDQFSKILIINCTEIFKSKLFVHYFIFFIFLAIPLPPGAPTVTDWSERHMDITWSEPLDDGNAAITSYHIEAKSKGSISISRNF